MDFFSIESKVGLKVLEKGEKGAHLMELVKDLSGLASKVSISNAIDKLLDKGVLHGEWKKSMIETEVGRRNAWVRNFSLRGEWKEIFQKYYDTL